MAPSQWEEELRAWEFLQRAELAVGGELNPPYRAESRVRLPAREVFFSVDVTIYVDLFSALERYKNSSSIG